MGIEKEKLPGNDTIHLGLDPQLTSCPSSDGPENRSRLEKSAAQEVVGTELAFFTRFYINRRRRLHWTNSRSDSLWRWLGLPVIKAASVSNTGTQPSPTNLLHFAGCPKHASHTQSENVLIVRLIIMWTKSYFFHIAYLWLCILMNRVSAWLSYFATDLLLCVRKVFPDL